MKRLILAWLAAAALVPMGALGGHQDRYALPEPYLGWERQYLKDFPDLQRVMDVMVGTTARQLKDPAQDILHNRVCSALAYRMATDMKLPRNDRRLITAGDLLHNIAKEDRVQVLTDVELLQEASEMVARLRAANRLAGSPGFWTDPGIFARTGVGANLSLVHHITGAIAVGEILGSVNGYSARDILRVQEAIVTHSTGYWYFRKSVDDAAHEAGAWRKVYPEPEGALSKIVHDADLISQFEAESVVPQGSKWRVLAAKRWGAKGAVEEAHVVYYVFQRLFEEARTPQGKALAEQEWSKIRPELVKLMRLPTGADPVRALGVPKAFQ
jgi:hypothetical protein